MTAAIGLALLASLLFGVGDFLGGTMSRRVALTTVLLISQLAATVVLLPKIARGSLASADSGALIWGAVAGVAMAVALASLFKALAEGTMGVVAPITALSVAVPVVAGLVDGDRFGPGVGVGLGTAVVGTVLASGPEMRTPGEGGHGRRPVLLAVLAALAFGLANLAIARGSASGVTATVFVASIVTLTLYALAATIARRLPVAQGRDLVGIVAAGLIGVGALLAFGAASRAGSLTLVAVLAALYPAVTALLGWRVHGEHLRRVQVVGVVAVLAGVAVVAGSTTG